MLCVGNDAQGHNAKYLNCALWPSNGTSVSAIPSSDNMRYARQAHERLISRVG